MWTGYPETGGILLVVPRHIAFVALAALLAGCGGRAQNDGGTDSGAACVTTLACGAGERCDGGRCVDDSGCPPGREPQALLDVRGGDPWAAGTPVLVAIAGREYLSVSAPPMGFLE